jgi:arylsulfatase A-like enzyme
MATHAPRGDPVRKDLMLKTFLAAFVLALLATARPAGAATTAPARRPNILYVLIDDMGYGDLTCYGDKLVHTDNLDRLAAEGIKFTQFYVNCPICSPSRTAMMTGQYPERWKITSYLENRAANQRRGMANWLDVSAPTVARQLRDAGYTTGHFGKWHMGGQRDVGDAPLVSEYGFDKTLTTFEGLGDRILPLLDAYDGTPAKKYALGSDKLGRGNITWMERSKVTSGFATAAIAFIRQAEKDGKPFYVDVWPDDVHSPFFPPADLRGDGSKRARYLGVVQATDDQLKPLIDLVRDDPQLRDNTLIVVASDNGPELGAGTTGPFRGQKGNLYEGGVREPFITWGPGLLEKSAVGTVNDRTVVAGFDLLPSFLALAGRSPAADQRPDGEDRLDVMLGRSRAPRARPLMWMRPPDRPGSNAQPWPDLSIRQDNWKLLVNADGTRPELYDLSNDIGERANLADAHKDLVQTLSKQVIAWYQALPVKLPPRPKGNGAPDYLRNDQG